MIVGKRVIKSAFAKGTNEKMKMIRSETRKKEQLGGLFKDFSRNRTEAELNETTISAITEPESFKLPDIISNEKKKLTEFIVPTEEEIH